ncbi:HD domain-containing protein [Deferribacter thermophilus]|uniref:HD domain-containing protein n=1 Tax=Deferribacter thermophilus TaxID=53573 RepID=UPI003C25B094
MKDISNDSLTKLVDFFFETGLLQQLQRSGIPFLGSGSQTVASHIFRTTLIGYSIAKLADADITKVILMCLFHDIEETRIGDLNYLQQKYVISDDKKALYDLLELLPFKEEIAKIIKEYEEQKTLEAKIAKDADTLELILFLKENLDKGNEQALFWIKNAQKRLKTSFAKKIFDIIMERKYYDWWQSIENDWTNGNKTW